MQAFTLDMAKQALCPDRVKEVQTRARTHACARPRAKHAHAHGPARVCDRCIASLHGRGRDKIVAWIPTFLVLRFWDQNTMASAGAMPFRREFFGHYQDLELSSYILHDSA